MTPQINRWSDDRLDDMKRRVDDMNVDMGKQGRTLIEHDGQIHAIHRQITEIVQTGDRRRELNSERSWTLRLLLLANGLGLLSNIVVTLVKH